LLWCWLVWLLYPCFGETLSKSLPVESARCPSVFTKQQNLFIPVMLKWSKDRFVHRLQFMCILTW
jgi:hypothetical protein